MHPTDLKRSALLYSCYTQKTREEQRFIPEHMFIRILSGNMQIDTVNNSYTLIPGDTILLKRNQLIKAVKLPPENGKFAAVTVFFDQLVLKEYTRENKISVPLTSSNESMENSFISEKKTGDLNEDKIAGTQPNNTQQVMFLQHSLLYESYATSLTAYQEGSANNGLTGLKVKEALMLMLHLDPEAAKLLFDFREPEKAELKTFMNTHFKFNVHIRHLAYLTGRSLATFKRDFSKTFSSSPNKWLQERRLKEAHYLMKEKGMKVTEVYLEVGFEDLSHFSFAFKKAYGKAPSRI